MKTLSAPKTAVMVFFWQHYRPGWAHGAHTDEIARQCDTTSAFVGRTLASLRSSGLVERKRVKHGLLKGEWWSLTGEGVKLCEKIFPAQDPCQGSAPK